MKAWILWVALFASFASYSALAAWNVFGIRMDPPCDYSMNKIYAEGSAEILFERALNEERDGSFCNASKLLLEIQRQHPHSPLYKLSMHAVIRTMMAEEDYDRAITAAKEFLQLYEHSPLAEDALFWIGESYYLDRGNGKEADSSWTAKAQMTLAAYLRTYPEGKYLDRAKAMLEENYNELAAKELEIGKYYFGQEEWVAAGGRFQRVLKLFKSSVHVPESLYWLAACLLKLNREKDALNAKAILDKVYAASPWAEEAARLFTAHEKEKAKNKQPEKSKEAPKS